MIEMKKDLLVIKVGTNVLASTAEGKDRLRLTSFRSIASDIRALQKRGYGIILVSSAAITAGSIEDGVERHTVSNTVEEQRLAARGWDIIVQKWKKAMGRKHISSALITKHDLTTHNTRKKLLQVISCCLGHSDVFLVNENDCLTDDEIKFGDNDILSAMLAATCATHGDFNSVALILLTNKNGLNRVVEDDATIIRTVENIDAIRRYAGESTSQHSRGGMISKIMAADIATNAGVPMYIANGHSSNPASNALDVKTGTYFAPKK